MPENTNLININNNKSQISLDENLLGEFEITILPQEGGSSQDALGLGKTSTKVNIEVKTNDPEDLLPKLKILGFKLYNFSK